MVTEATRIGFAHDKIGFQLTSELQQDRDDSCWVD